MNTMYEVKESTYLYGDRIATLFKINGVKIIGFKNGKDFDLRVLTIGGNPRRVGLGENSLRLIRPNFETIMVNEIDEGALLFWIKMKERGLIDKIGRMKGELNYNLANRN